MESSDHTPPADPRHPEGASRSRRRTGLAAKAWAALAGVLAAACVFATADLFGIVLGYRTGPFVAMGEQAIALSPGWAKEIAIQLLGSADKAALLTGLGVLAVLLAALSGILELRHAPWGLLLLVACSLAVASVVALRSHGDVLSPLPTVAGALIGAVVLRMALVPLRAWHGERSGTAPIDRGIPQHDPVARRSFLVFMAGSGLLVLIAGVGSRFLSLGTTTANAARSLLRLPRAATPAPAVPPGAHLHVPDLAPFVTSNDGFYRVNIDVVAPAIDVRSWTLRITGMVEREITLDYDKLLSLPLTEHMVTLACVSNPVGGYLVGNATWLGYPIRSLLARAHPLPGADMVLSRSVDDFTASTPLDVLRDPGTEALIAIGMNGRPLPPEHGFPARMIVPGLYGYVSATKWLTQLDVTTFAEQSAYWTEQGWAPHGPVKTSSRIDTPVANAVLASGRIVVAGVAWAQHTGIARVQLRIDTGPWHDATLADSVSKDTWRQWRWTWDAVPGDHTLTVRATDASGYTQTGILTGTAPDGATGWHHVAVRVR